MLKPVEITLKVKVPTVHSINERTNDVVLQLVKAAEERNLTVVAVNVRRP